MPTRPGSAVRRRWPWPSRASISPRWRMRPTLCALVCQCRRDAAATQAHADTLIAIAAAHRLPLRVEQGRLLRGWALAMQGEAAAGVAHLRQALASPDVGPESLRPYWLTVLAEAYGQAGQPEAGLQVLAEAVRLVAATGSAGGRPRCPGSRERYCSNSPAPRSPRRKWRSSRPWTWPAASRRRPWSCAPR